jgi:hypothetical protein
LDLSYQPKTPKLGNANSYGKHIELDVINKDEVKIKRKLKFSTPKTKFKKEFSEIDEISEDLQNGCLNHNRHIKAKLNHMSEANSSKESSNNSPDFRKQRKGTDVTYQSETFSPISLKKGTKYNTKKQGYHTFKSSPLITKDFISPIHSPIRCKNSLNIVTRKHSKIHGIESFLGIQVQECNNHNNHDHNNHNHSIHNGIHDHFYTHNKGI